MQFNVNDSQQVLDFIQKAAKIGTWQVLLEPYEIQWSDITREIHDVGKSYNIELEKALDFYKEGYSRDKITYYFNRCIEQGEPYDVELELVSAKGREKWVRAIGFPVLENEKCVKVQGLFQDITEKNKTQKKVALREQQFRKTFDSASIGMAIVSLEGKFIRVNQSLRNILGYTTDEFKTFNFKDITHKDDTTLGDKKFAKLLSNEISNFQIEKRYLHKNGSIIWASLNVSLVSNEDATPLHLVAQINDITKRKESEKKVNTLLEITKDQNSRLLNFAHIVSHNLRSHSGNLEMLLDLMKHEEPEATDNSYFPLVDTAVNNLSETVENLNQVAILNTKLHEDLTPTNLYEAINKTKESLKAHILENDGSIINNVPKHLIIDTVPAYLDSILLNFISNSIKYKKPDVAPKININTSFTDDNQYLILKIEDNGMGIDLNRHRKKLFGMYKTFHKHKDSRGLGLFITKNQVEAIGGKIEVESEVGIGTTFLLHLKHEIN